MFEKEAEEYYKEHIHYDEGRERHYFDVSASEAFKDGAEFGYKKAKEDADKMKSRFLELCNLKDMRIEKLEKANEWHYVKDGDLPKENQKCYFIHSNTYDESNKVSFAEGVINVLTGIYSFFLDEEGNQTTEPSFYDDISGDEWDLSEVYAWKEIVLPELPKES